MPPTRQRETDESAFRSAPARSFYELLRWRQASAPEGAAIFAPDRLPLTNAGLFAQLAYTSRALRTLNLGHHDRLALVLPDGPEMAAAFLCLSACAACAPLNPAYRADDFDFYLGDVQAKALLVLAGLDSPARTVAAARGLPILELAPQSGQCAGTFRLLAGAAPIPTNETPASFREPADAALILHTSGTTSRPKMVPLTQANLCTSAGHIAATLALTPADRCLSLMPLFHIHGLIGGLLSSMISGASVICAPGPDAARFFAWLDTLQPTWYTAVPTLHQAILARAGAAGEIIGRNPLRFIRSSSASLPPSVMQELERVFGAPVIEAYGMTEASHQMASNPLPPRARKPGSVGPAAGPEVAIMDESGQLRPAGETGEIVIRGPNVTAGYDHNPEANQKAFVNGWFRTGDQGYLDAEGYLFITGRLKEIINRGGEKISPREIDEALLAHPGVQQAAAFAVRHPTLGEMVAAAVAPRAGQTLDEQELRTFAASRLPDFKVPSRIVIVPEIPKGPTGKVQRIGLAERLAGALAIPYEAPKAGLEQLVASVFKSALPQAPAGRHDNFFLSGGDSLLTTRVLARLEQALQFKIPIRSVFEAPTVATLAKRLATLRASGAASPTSRIPRLSREAFREKRATEPSRTEALPSPVVATGGPSQPETRVDTAEAFAEGEAAPRTDTEKLVARIWAEVLQQGSIGLADNFFARGGHSLLAMRVLARLHSGLGVELPVRSIFETPTLAALAARIDLLKPAALPPPIN